MLLFLIEVLLVCSVFGNCEKDMNMFEEVELQKYSDISSA
jgi:hypothetical protein